MFAIGSFILEPEVLNLFADVNSIGSLVLLG